MLAKTIEIKTSYGTERGYCLCFVYSFVHVGGLYLSLIFHIWGKATGSIRGLYLVCLWVLSLHTIEIFSEMYENDNEMCFKCVMIIICMFYYLLFKMI